MKSTSITIVTPCYNEHVIVIRFLETVEKTLRSLPYTFNIVVVNDGSKDGTLDLLKGFRFNAPNIILNIINLPCNMGHQAAIYQGFLYAQVLDSDRFIVMDADGEDDPAIIPALIDHKEADVVHVVRSGRTESLLFRLGYSTYKGLFRLATGKQMNFGNYCMISRRVMELAIRSNFTHLAAFLAKQALSRQFIAANKQPRIGGKSKMGFKKHLAHAIHSFAEHGVRLINVPNRDSGTPVPIYEFCSDGHSEKAL